MATINTDENGNIVISKNLIALVSMIIFVIGGTAGIATQAAAINAQVEYNMEKIHEQDEKINKIQNNLESMNPQLAVNNERLQNIQKDIKIIKDRLNKE